MTPLSLLLRGFAGIRAGLGKIEFQLDLEALDPEARIVAIAGPNGAGKSTVIDNLHPYRVMPSRSSTLSPGGFSFYDHLVGPEALKQLEWRHNGHRYRSSLVFKMNGKRRTEGYVHEVIDGALKPVRLEDGTVSNGSTENYDRIIEGLLGSPEMFFTSAFSAQNRKPLSAYGNTEVKSLMVDLLHLENIREQGDKAASVVRALKAALEQKRSALKVQEDLASQLDMARSELLVHEKGELEVTMTVAARQDAVGHAERALGEAQAAAREQKSAALRRTVIQANVKEEVERETLERKEHERRLTDLQGRKNDIELEEDRCRISTSEKQARLRIETQSVNELIAAEKDVASARERIEGLRTSVENARRNVLEAEELALKVSALREAQAHVTERIQSVEQQAGAAALRAQELKERLQLTEEVPCHGTNLQGQCKLLGEANAGRPILPSAQADLKRLAEERQTLHAQSSQLQADLRMLDDVNRQIEESRQRFEQCREQHAQAVSLVALEPSIAAARKRRAQIEVEIATLSEDVERLRLEDQRRLGQVSEETKRHIEQFEAAQRARRRRIELLEQELSNIPLPDTVAESHSEELLREAKVQLQLTERELRAILEKKARAAARVAVLAAAAGEAHTLQRQVENLQDEIGWWSLLAKALGHDGIIALCIDDAGPALSHLTNDLLMSCYGPRFTVSIRTQLETAKGGQKEGFDVVVFDAKSGSVQSLSVMSGGERVWINECLTRAVALYLAQGSSSHYETLFCDETDGALDPERKNMFMQMKREVLRLGGYRREYFISQTPALTELADAVIHLTRERSTETGEWSDSAIKYA